MSLKRVYELMLLFSGSLPETEVKKEIDLIKKDLASSGAEKIEEDYWGRRDLAYKFGPDYSGYFEFIKMKSEGKAMVEMKSKLMKNEKVLRLMVTRAGDQ